MRFESSKHIFAYWRRLRAGRAAPERSAFNPAALGIYLPGVFLLERDTAGQHLFRVAGTGLCMLFGEELRGRSFLSLLSQSALDDGRELLSTATEDLLPVVAGASALLESRQSVEAEMLILPLLDNGRSGQKLLGALAYRAGDRHSLGRCAALDILSFRVIGDSDTRHLQPASQFHVIDGQRAERRGHLLVYEGGAANN